MPQGQLCPCALITDPVLRAQELRLRSLHAASTEARTPSTPGSATRETTAVRSPSGTIREELLLTTTRGKPVPQGRPGVVKENKGVKYTASQDNFEKRTLS